MAKKKFKPRDFETTGSNLSAAVYASMMQSKAWHNLSNNARVLYLYMKLQLYGAKIKDHPETDFYFNTAMAQKTYGLYSNMAQFRKDRQQLIDNGFIDVVENGRFTRTKNVYRFSSRWKEIG